MRRKERKGEERRVEERRGAERVKGQGQTCKNNCRTLRPRVKEALSNDGQKARSLLFYEQAVLRWRAEAEHVRLEAKVMVWPGLRSLL